MFPTIPLVPFDVAEVYRRLGSRARSERLPRGHRREYRQMQQLDDRLLRDIGLTRDNARYAGRARRASDVRGELAQFRSETKAGNW